MTPELRATLEAQRAATDALQKKADASQKKAGTIIPWVFHRGGRPLGEFRKSWATACLEAGLATAIEEVKDGRKRVAKIVAHRIPHDFRRTAVRNLERAGVPRSTAMKMVGHRTESIYRRYAIVDAAMLREGSEKLALAESARG